ncbi:hypothetical protein HZF08_22605 [Paenibacillus sp. CGMCC 1.16610]|uniref:Uncharacterized protein n=1 Tax=Paenibacillus anseongense TaxID=2682845 RepID=A0ABW9UIA6_9BACL|nr:MULTISPECIES: hypothetical protein [Paenibacillus]MBA2941075.1 hypothetical protein [Paenibacillus sp. CGMCC 1.16610]MVQ39894.1 hypothetical protein [Paenibacillus anseongense]
MAEHERKNERIVLPILFDDDEDDVGPLIDDVRSDQAEAGYFIEAMKRAGVEREKIAETLVQLNKIYTMPPYEATRIYYEFKGENEQE